MSTKILKNENVYSNLRLVYIIALVLYSLARQNITSLQPYLLSNWINIGFTLIAFLLILWDVLAFKNIFKARHISLCWIFMGLAVISTLLNLKYAFFDNVKSLVNLCIQLFLLYASGHKKSKERLNFEARALSHSLALVWGTGAAISFFMYIFNVYYTQTRYLWGEAITIGQGFVHQHNGVTVMRLWGVFVDPNFASAISLIVLILSLYVIFSSKHLVIKILHGFNVIFQTLYIILSNSRMATLATYIVILVATWFLSYRLFKTKKKILKEFLSIGLVVVMTVAGIAAISAVKTGLPYIKRDITSSSGSDSEEVESLDREDMAVKTDISNGRFNMMKEGLQVFSSKPILGVGPRGYHAYASEYYPDTVIASASVHNSYLELLMGNGALGALVMFWFLLLCAKDTLKFRFRNSESFTPIAFLMLCVFSILITSFFIANLWYTLSGSTVILFAVLGYAVQLMKIEEEESLETDDVLFVCETPYHIINAQRLAASLPADVKKDMYIYNQFPKAKSIAKRIKATDTFENVVLVRRYKRHNGISSKLVTLFRVFFPKRTLYSHFIVKQKDKRYKTVYAAYFTHLLDSVKAVNPKSELVMFEDGLASYQDKNIENEARTGIFKLVDRFIFGGSFTYNAKTVYLNQPQCYKGSYFENVKKLPELDDLDLTKAVLKYKENSIYKDSKTVYLTQPLSDTEFKAIVQKTDREILSCLDTDTVIRVHPRQKDNDYTGFTVDDINNPWELECESSITDEHVLISAFSSALFNPKMLSDKEPAVIFTFKLYGDIWDFDDMVEMLRSMYKNPEKVMTPSTVEELRACLDKFA